MLSNQSLRSVVNRNCPYCGRQSDDEHILQCEKTSPLISVIVPSRVGEEIETLPSLKKQTYKNLEIIVEYDEKQKGASVVRNRGAGKAKGKYFFFCDNDLDLSPTCLSDLYITLISNPEAKWAFGKFRIHGENVYNEGKQLNVPKDEKSVEFIEWFRGISTMSLIDATIKPVFDEEFKKFNDWDLWLTLYKKGYKPAFCNKILFKTAFKSGGISLANNAKFWQDKLYGKHRILGYENALRKQEENRSDYADTLNKKELETLQKDEIIRQKNEEIEFMKSSKFWKAREKYCGLKSKMRFKREHK